MVENLNSLSSKAKQIASKLDKIDNNFSFEIFSLSSIIVIYSRDR